MILLQNSISLRWIWNYEVFKARLFDKFYTKSETGKCADFANILVLIFGASANCGRFFLNFRRFMLILGIFRRFKQKVVYAKAFVLSMPA